MAQAKDIREKVLWVIQSQENQKGGGGTDLRVLQWIIDGKPSKPALEKRDWYLTQEGERKLGKAKGMGAGDLYLVIKNIRAIAKLLLVKPEHLEEALQLIDFQPEPPKSGTPPAASSSPSSLPPLQEPLEPVASGAPPDVNF